MALPREFSVSSQLLRIKEAAEYLNIPLRTLYPYYQVWGIPFVRIGRSILFKQSDLDAYIESSRVRVP